MDDTFQLTLELKFLFHIHIYFLFIILVFIYVLNCPFRYSGPGIIFILENGDGCHYEESGERGGGSGW